MSLQTQIYSFVERVDARFDALEASTGSLALLNTASNTSLVAAINELAVSHGHTHTQRYADTLWNINHNLGLRPAVTIIDSGGHEVEADVVHLGINQLVIHFAIPVAGLARLT